MSEQRGLHDIARIGVPAEVLVCEFRHHSSARRALDEAFHDEIRLIDLLHRAGVLTDCRGDGGDAHRTALELVDNSEQDLVVYLVQTVLVDVERRQGDVGDLGVNPSRPSHLSEVSHSPEQSVGNTWRSARASRNLYRGIIVDRHPEDARRTLDDTLQRLRIIIFQMQVDAETCAQRRREQSASGRGTHQRKGVQVYLYGACRRTLVYHYVDAVVLHGGIQIFFHHGRKSVYLVDEEHIVRLQRREYSCQVAGFVEHRSARYLEAHSQFISNDIAQRGLSQSWRTVQQRMVERFAPVFRRLHEHLQVLHHLLLSAEISEFQRSQGILKLLLRRTHILLSYIEIVVHYFSYFIPLCEVTQKKS